MKIKALMVSAACVSLLAACGGGSDDSSPRPDPERFAGSGQIGVIPTADQRFSGDVQSMVYDPSTDTLTILGDPFASDGEFVRVPEKDVRGFAAFENEGGTRRYTALVRTDSLSGLSAGVVGTPVRFNNEFGGTMLARADTPTVPLNVELTHVGSYAGIRNVGRNVGDDDSNSFLHRVEGQVRINLDFFDDRPAGAIEGVIFDRISMDQTVEIDDDLLNVIYEDIVLEFTDIDSQGRFSGIAAGGGISGTYAGVTSDDQASATAGVIEMQGGGELERGAFITQTE